MKKLNQALLALVMILSFSSIATAQKTTVKANILSPLVRTGSFFVEHSVKEGMSVQLGGFYTGATSGTTNLKGFGVTPEVRFYLSENAEKEMTGFYLAPFVRYQNLDLTIDDVEGSAEFEGFGGGFTVGGQWILKKNIVIDTFIGPKYGTTSLTVKDGATEEDFDLGNFGGFGLRAGVSLGIAF